MQAKVLGLGNALVDILVRIPSDEILERFEMPRGSMQLVEATNSAEIYNEISHLNPSHVSGGSAANTIYGLANLGIQTGMIGKIGKHDELGASFLADLEQSGVEPHLFYSEDSSTGSCISLISQDSERTMATCLGAAIELTPEEIDPKIFDGYTHFYVEGYMVQNALLIEKTMKLAHEKGLCVCLDLASYNVVEDNLDFLKSLMTHYVDVVFANEEESTAFTGKEDLEALNEIGELVDIVVIKLGRRGSIVKVHDRVERVGIIAANSIDTTGAGDLYAAGFIYGMINNLPPKKSAEAGAITSGNVIEVMGTKMDAQRWNNIRQALKSL
ncbi:MAG: adenosine kinase [Marinilabiliaceae bacterium]|nr:adenosine kinase [Marinilabiliaceae bacterium]